jgi:metacaspase-1
MAKAAATKARAMSLHIGLNSVSPKHYEGCSGPLAACEFDANDMQALAQSQGIAAKKLLTKSKFAAGVRVLVLSDSCHSGTVTRARPEPPPPGTRAKLMPADVALRVYAAHSAFYDGLQSTVAKTAGKAPLADPDAVLATLSLQSGRIQSIAKKFKAAVILISGCQDNQVSLDGDHNGAFTGQLRRIWNNGKFKGTHAKFHAPIVAGMSASQTPNLFLLGPAGAFAAQQPFEV